MKENFDKMPRKIDSKILSFAYKYYQFSSGTAVISKGKSATAKNRRWTRKARSDTMEIL